VHTFRAPRLEAYSSGVSLVGIAGWVDRSRAECVLVQVDRVQRHAP
jgi:hypothetical protein